jgi:hypothetical protein
MAIFLPHCKYKLESINDMCNDLAYCLHDPFKNIKRIGEYKKKLHNILSIESDNLNIITSTKYSEYLQLVLDNFMNFKKEQKFEINDEHNKKVKFYAKDIGELFNDYYKTDKTAGFIIMSNRIEIKDIRYNRTLMVYFQKNMVEKKWIKYYSPIINKNDNLHAFTFLLDELLKDKISKMSVCPDKHNALNNTYKYNYMCKIKETNKQFLLEYVIKDNGSCFHRFLKPL